MNVIDKKFTEMPGLLKYMPRRLRGAQIVQEQYSMFFTAQSSLTTVNNKSVLHHLILSKA
jgi:hypothetical protein